MLVVCRGALLASRRSSELACRFLAGSGATATRFPPYAEVEVSNVISGRVSLACFTRFLTIQSGMFDGLASVTSALV